MRDNRERDQIEGISDPRQVVETVTFLRPELDRMVFGFRRATETTSDNDGSPDDIGAVAMRTGRGVNGFIFAS